MNTLKWKIWTTASLKSIYCGIWYNDDCIRYLPQGTGEMWYKLYLEGSHESEEMANLDC